jgi:polar amino acid transport system substrate-binding protein
MTDQTALRQFAPTGTIRCGVVVAPAASAFFAIQGNNGPEGVTVDLFRALGEELKLPVHLAIFPNSGELTEATSKADCDVAFMPQDAERAKKVDFGPAYMLIESTFLVPAGSSIATLEQANFPGARAIVIAGTTTARSARRFLTQGSVEEVRGVDDMTRMAKAGEADLFALSHDAFDALLPKLPGARVLAGSFQQVGVAVAVPKGRAAALKLVTKFVERAKSNGAIRKALDRAGFQGSAVAPPARG